jgi:hypothetical protein
MGTHDSIFRANYHYENNNMLNSPTVMQCRSTWISSYRLGVDMSESQGFVMYDGVGSQIQRVGVKFKSVFSMLSEVVSGRGSATAGGGFLESYTTGKMTKMTKQRREVATEQETMAKAKEDKKSVEEEL